MSRLLHDGASHDSKVNALPDALPALRLTLRRFDLNLRVCRSGEQRYTARALGHVLEWYAVHKPEIEENWQLARNRQPLKPIEPLE